MLIVWYCIDISKYLKWITSYTQLGILFVKR